MKKLLGAVVGAAALMVSGIASAAPVDIVFERDTNQLTLRVDAGISVGYVSLAFAGATSFVPAPSAQISTADSVLDVSGGFAIIVSPFNVAMVPGGSPDRLSIGTLLFSSVQSPCGPLSSQPGSACTTIREDVDNLGAAVLDIAGAEVASSVSIVPEPSTLALLGLGLAGLALVRRTA